MKPAMIHIMAIPDTCLYLGNTLPVAVNPITEGPDSCRFAEDKLEVRMRPAGTAHTQALILEDLLRRWLRREAQTILPERLSFWAQQLSVSPRRLVLNNPRRQWGSCNANGTISLNQSLIRAPLELIDYVAAHELCHMRHLNHSPAFWGLLGSVMPDYARRRAALRMMEKELDGR